MNFYNRLSKLNESSTLLEYNRKDLRNFVGDEYAAKFFSMRDKFQAPENDLGHWIKKGDPEALKKYLDDWESGVNKSKTQQKKDERMEGADLVFDDKGWKVYHISKYEAAKQFGSGTTWCITGRYNGYESRGKEFFNNYIRDYKLDDGYYFMLDTMNKDPNTGDYLKYCAGINKDNKLVFLYNGIQDREISSYGIPNIPPERQVQPFADKGVTIKYHQTFIVEDGVLTKVDKQDLYEMRSVTIPSNVEVIGKFVFDESKLGEVDMSKANIREIRTGAFADCSRLYKFEMPNTVEKLGNGILLSSGVKRVKFSDALKVIPDKTCAFCYNLWTVILPNNVESISDTAFSFCDDVVLDNCNAYAVEYANKLGIKYVDPETGELMNAKR